MCRYNSLPFFPSFCGANFNAFWFGNASFSPYHRHPPPSKKKNRRHCDNYKLNFWKKLRVNWNGKFLSGVWQIVCKMLFLEYQVIFCNFFRNVRLVFQIWIIVCHWISEDTLFRWKSYCFQSVFCWNIYAKLFDIFIFLM